MYGGPIRKGFGLLVSSDLGNSLEISSIPLQRSVWKLRKALRKFPKNTRANCALGRQLQWLQDLSLRCMRTHSLFCHHFAFATLVATAVLKTAVTTVTLSLRNASLSEDARFSELQCSFTGNRVDTEDGEGAKQTQIGYHSGAAGSGFRASLGAWGLTGSHQNPRVGKSDHA